MKFLYSDEPIIACSTGNRAHAAMAVLRISGFKDLTTYSQFFSLKIDQVIPRKVYFTKLLDEGETLDEICLTYFKSPKSYNGENILELSVHGNTLNVERIIFIFKEVPVVATLLLVNLPIGPPRIKNSHSRKLKVSIFS